ncbi:MAG: MotA/TolQ/ExbB proton channel family protein [Planctomycetaceae bacterium]
MSTSTVSASHSHVEPGNRPASLFLQIALSPWLWGLALAAGFYAAIEFWPVWPAWVYRYFCMHWTERVLMSLSFVGLSILAIKSLTVSWEWSVFRRVRDFGISDPTAPLPERLSQLQERVHALEDRNYNTYWGNRLRHLLVYFQQSNSSEGTSDHVAYLSEAAADRMFASYSLMNTVVWAVPIIGFLGTVMGITLAIANLTPDQLDTALNSVTRDLALAFDTTAIALTSSLILGFLSLFVKRNEEQLLSEIDERCRLEINRCFPDAPTTNPVVEAHEKVAEQLLAQSDEFVAGQSELWSQTLNDFRDRWSQLVDTQQQAMSTALGSSHEASAAQHAQLLKEFRDEFVAAYTQVTESLLGDLLHRENFQEQQNELLEQRFQQLSDAVCRGFEQTMQQHQSQTSQSVDQLSQRLSVFVDSLNRWQTSFDKLSDAAAHHAMLLQQQTAALADLRGNEADLVRLQSSLAENLKVVRAAETFDETLHNLTAAVHLLTARSRAA